MKGLEQEANARVMKVNSKESWDFFISQSTTKGCPVAVHFTAVWCMPSVAMNHFFEELASTYPDMLFLTVDVDELNEVAASMEVKAMPTFVLMKEGKTVEKLVGANPEEMKKRIDGFLQSIRLYVA